MSYAAKAALDSLTFVAADVWSRPDNPWEPVQVCCEERQTSGNAHAIPFAVAADKVEVTCEDVCKWRGGIEVAFFDPVRFTCGIEIHSASAKKKVIDIGFKVDDELIEILEIRIVSPHDAVQESRVFQWANLKVAIYIFVVVIDEH